MQTPPCALLVCRLGLGRIQGCVADAHVAAHAAEAFRPRKASQTVDMACMFPITFWGHALNLDRHHCSAGENLLLLTPHASQRVPPQKRHPRKQKQPHVCATLQTLHLVLASNHNNLSTSANRRLNLRQDRDKRETEESGLCCTPRSSRSFLSRPSFKGLQPRGTPRHLARWAL